MNKETNGKISRNSILIVFAVSLVYLLNSFFLIGFKTDQLVLTATFNICFFLSPVTRKFIIAFSIFIVYWILFDYMKAFPNYTFNAVHIQDLYDAEKSLFGITYQGKIITANEYWLLNGRTWLDILSGIFYLCWIPVPLAFAAYLFFKDKNLFLHFSLTFVLVNLLGFIIYYAYPAAPPWYYQLNGAHFLPGTPGNTAALHKFDDYFNINVFRNIYEKSSNVFAAMPSLHSSYPLIVVYYGIKKKLGWVNLLFVAVTLGIWFAAVYTSHHYILDVLAGTVCAMAGIFIFQKILLRNSSFRKFLDFYKANI
ncbi:MAG: inositol phosphorylceramide synthase [Ferruginibacter sp.]|nr:inositol phosphorylceramide synthase [Ferruginibacter sp.]